MSWRAIVDAAYARRERARPRYEPPVTHELVSEAEHRLGCALPEELKSLLLEANGIMELIDIHGTWIENMWLMWSVEELLERNRELRRVGSDGSFPSGALAFADAGVDGILFAFDMEGNFDVFAWHPIGAQRQEMAASLGDFLPRWIGGDLSV
jgi:hypothetical protein